MTSMNQPETSTTRTRTTPMPAGLDPTQSYQPPPTVQQTTARRRFGWDWDWHSAPAWVTTELVAYLGTVLAVIFTAAFVTDGPGRGDTDYFRADKAMLFITLLTIGFLLSIGLGKGRRSHWVDRD